MSPIPTIVRWISRRALRWCYREVRYVGRERVPADGPTLLFGNHQNDLPDVLAGFFTTDRPLRYIATSSAVTRPLANATYRGMGVIPVTRVRDARIMRSRGVDPAAVNRSAFASVQEAFRAGDIVGVFPEGGVHDSSSIGKPRAGVAKMALESIDNGATIDLKLIAFGVQYDAQQTARSDLTVVLGESFSLRSWVEHQTDPSPSALSARLHKELLSVARSISSWPNAEARDRLVAAVSACSATSAEPLLETSANVQRRCGFLVEGCDPSQTEQEVPIVHWRTISDELAELVHRAGGLATSARDTARVLDAAGSPNPQACWPTRTWMLATVVPATIGLILNGPMQWSVWQLAGRTATARTDRVARAILPGLHLIFLGYVVLGGLFALGFRASSLSAWWALPVVMLLPRLGDLGLAWRDAVCAWRLRARVQRLSVGERAAIRAAAERVWSAWMTLSTPSSSSS
ncbi:MAG: lysophospholipid acyltransferase family protein [Gemmatimonas sp.]